MKDGSRDSFAARVPRSVKRTAGRTAAPLVPANIRAFDTTLTQEDREQIRQQLGAKLGKFAESIERVTVRVRDVNGPRGGVDTNCRIKVVLSGFPSIIVEENGTSFEPAFKAALDSTTRAVRKTLEKRRSKTIKAGSRKRTAGD